MRTYRYNTGPFSERPYYSQEDIEQICVEALKKVGLFPTDPSPIRIERFIEKRFGVNPSYEELPQGVLGYSAFGPTGLTEVVVSRLLVDEDSKSASRRVNSTLAHEAGHALLHMHLFVLGTLAPGLFGGEVATPKILCRDEGIPVSDAKKYDGRWWEYQANRAIGALLMPRVLVHKAVESLLDRSESRDAALKALIAASRDQVTRQLSAVFDVNPAVARLRLDELFPKTTQQGLTF